MDYTKKDELIDRVVGAGIMFSFGFAVPLVATCVGLYKMTQYGWNSHAYVGAARKTTMGWVNKAIGNDTEVMPDGTKVSKSTGEIIEEADGQAVMPGTKTTVPGF